MHRVLILLMLFMPFSSTSEEPLSLSFINKINNNQSQWQAGLNFDPCTPYNYLLALLGTRVAREKLPVMEYYESEIINLPEIFDSRQKWPECLSIQHVRDQGNCGSCWAVSSVEAMTDRYCIHSNGTFMKTISVEDLITCLSSDYGCRGGYPNDAYKFWKSDGIVTGGPYDSKKGCKPYKIAPCQHCTSAEEGVLPMCGGPMKVLPACDYTCEPGYPVPYFEDKHYGDKIYSLISEDNIRADIFKNGPVTASIEVYLDFFSYKSGVYKTILTQSTGKHHSIKIIGWGVEDGVNYWMVANSWNSDWGDKGFMKYIRGVNLGSIERNVVAGIPLLSDLPNY